MAAVPVLRSDPGFWIDTCCINKESSAELAEAINSMWRWYKDAAVCYAYLDDVPDKPVQIQESPSAALSSEFMGSLRSGRAQFRQSEWFTRGWTLQELLAPRNVVFLSESWARLGTKDELCDDISTITGIRRSIVLSSNPYEMSSCSAAEKLSWAADRRTSRVEDMAYCLLGLLDINMPLLYGEGSKAFVRLQEELIRSGDDESIFAWSYVSDVPTAGLPRSIFADTPFNFAACGNVQRANFDRREPFTMTNRGLRIDARLRRIPGRSGNERVLPLNCGVSGYESFWSSTKRPDFPLALYLCLVDPDRSLYRREGCVNMAQSEFGPLASSLWMEYPERENRLEHQLHLLTAVTIVLLFLAWVQRSCFGLRLSFWGTMLECGMFIGLGLYLGYRTFFKTGEGKIIFIAK